MKKIQFSVGNIFFRMLTGMVVIVLAGTAVAQEIVAKNGGYQVKVEKIFTVNPGGNLEMEDISGDVTIQSWGKNSVQIKEQLHMDVFTRGEAEEILKRAKTHYSKTDNTVSITGFTGKRHLRQNFDIFVPEEFNLNIHVSGGDISVTKLSGEIALKTSGGNIKLAEITGPVKAKTSGGNLEFSGIKGTLSAKTSGGNIKMRDIAGDADVRTSGGNISVINAGKNVSVHTSGGNLKIRGISGNLTGKTSGGSIDVNDCSGSVNVATSGGDIRAEAIGGKFSGSTSGGDIEGRGFDAPLDVKTSGGDVVLSGVNGAVTAKTSGGNMDVEITLQDFLQPHAVDLRTSGGDIKLTLPAKIPAKIVAEINLGRRERFWKRYDIYSDFPLSKEQTDEDGRKVIRSTGEINGGGDKIYLHTSGGNIYIKKR